MSCKFVLVKSYSSREDDDNYGTVKIHGLFYNLSSWRYLTSGLVLSDGEEVFACQLTGGNKRERS